MLKEEVTSLSKTTLKDVAARAGVSYQTVSKVLNGQAQVMPATEARIREAVEVLDYRPNVTARNLRTQESNLIGLAWYAKPYSAWQPILDRFLYSLIETLEERGYLIVFFNDKGSEHYHDISNLQELYARRQVAGFILANTIPNDPRIAYLIENQIPCVTFGRANSDWDFCWVDVDGEAGIKRMVQHLYRRGHRRVAYIGWADGWQTGRHREEGFRAGLAEFGLTCDETLIANGPDSAQAGATTTQRFLALSKSNRPTAIVCVSDLIAMGVCREVARAGLQIGQDIAVTGYDDVPMTELLNPPLTTIAQPIQQVGQHTVELLLKQLQGQPIIQKEILLEPELIVRESS